MFPLGPPGISNSPYQVLSAFAGNPLFISLEKLVGEGLLKPAELAGFSHQRPEKTDYTNAWRFKKKAFRKAFVRFIEGPASMRAGFDAFCHRQAAWLDDYALYCTIKEVHRGASWEEWKEPFRRRTPDALQYVRKGFGSRIQYHQFLQFQFFKQFSALKNFCRKNGVRVIGDVPIFVAHDSADVWANQELFWLDKKGKAIFVAGCPPDYFSATGQRWGNPLYNWEKMKKNGYAWWIRRFKTLFEQVDAARIDHFIGFHNYWRIPAAHKTAERGKWILAPGEDFLKTVFRKLGRIPLIAEDLGAITPAVAALRDKFGLPGMRVLQFAFDGNPKNPFLLENFIANTIVYTGTHDNDTTKGWFKSLKKGTRQEVQKYLGTDGKEIHWDLARAAWSSKANTAIVPAQDLLGLDSASRMNMPGTANGNWTWRLQAGALNSKISRRLADLTNNYGRHK